MDAAQIRQLGPKLNRFLKQFDDCFSRKDTRGHLPVFIKGQLSDLPEKSVEPIAVEAGMAPRTLQEFLSLLKWDQDQMRNRLQAIVCAEHGGPHAIGMFDETSDPKKGDKTNKSKAFYYSLHDGSTKKFHDINVKLIASVTTTADEGARSIAISILFSGGGTLDLTIDRQAWKAFNHHVLDRDLD
jgi:hypothetical protein